MSDQLIHKTKNKHQDTYRPVKDKSYRYITFSVLGFFIGFVITLIFFNYTLISFLGLSKFIVGFAVAGFLIPLKLYRKWFHFIKYEVIIFNVIGVAPILTALFLLLNFLITVETSTQELKIVELGYIGDGNAKTLQVVLENNVFSDNAKIIEINSITPDELLHSTHFRVTIGKGLFGYDVIKDKSFIRIPEAVSQ